MIPIFTYGSLADGPTYYEVVGRHPEGVPATLSGYRMERARGYTYLVEEEGSEVQGVLVRNVQTPDYWVLDDYQATAQGLYERRTVSVRADDRSVEAVTYVGGPIMTGLSE